jgi:hypothetical protein
MKVKIAMVQTMGSGAASAIQHNLDKAPKFMKQAADSGAKAS